MATLYCKDTCKYCVLAKEFLKEHNVPFEEVRMDPEEEGYAAQRDKLIEQSNGHKTFPWVFVKEEFVGGYTDLVHAFNTQKLHKLLEGAGVTIEEPDF
ncbi:Glutaredoxin [Hondaea fermentalgiana]|uniref:Glutaredoxin n=1 Tax=Hondaea fermentalgiana TaxID=2315210 RepID=A0A2R5GRX4_9STRA|nr:Glutaredoxin [Hondaea fermentalgiana]|eukprot:GBG33636.1 Glutaredoxin [Hondaea fermentalgiana]